MMTDQPKFGDVIRSAYIPSQAQQKKREFGKSPITVSGIETVYHNGDVIFLPFESGEISTFEAMGLAWTANQSGIGPAE